VPQAGKGEQGPAGPAGQMEPIDRLPQTGDKGLYLKQQLREKLVEHKHYIAANGRDLPEIRAWRWRA
jgi:xylulose-5-phosphate/fructose-6-phosphate phosphoketolase